MIGNEPLPTPSAEIRDNDTQNDTEFQGPMQPGADFNPLFSDAVIRLAQLQFASNPELS